MTLTASDNEIYEYLNVVKELIKNENNLILSLNRDKNLNFAIKYNLKKKDIIQIINKLTVKDFIEKVNNEHEDYKNEVLYVFTKNVDLVNVTGNTNNIDLYIKFNLLKKVILVSFNEAEHKFRSE